MGHRVHLEQPARHGIDHVAVQHQMAAVALGNQHRMAAVEPGTFADAERLQITYHSTQLFTPGHDLS